MLSKLFQLGGITVYSYGLMVAIAFIVGISIGARRARTLGEDPQNILDLCLWVMIFSLVGARLCYVIINIDYYSRYPLEIIMVNRGGLVFYGGIIGAIIASFLFIKIKKLNMGTYFDILSPSLAIGHALGRIGCFLNGCCYGRVIHSHPLRFIGVQFPRVVETVHNAQGEAVSQIIGAPAYLAHLNNGIITDTAQTCLPVYPTQLISSVGNLIIFFILTYLFSKRSFKGQIWWSYVMIYAVFRFLIEFLRGDNPPVPPFGFTFSQTLAIGLFIVGIIMYNYLKKKQAGIKSCPKTNGTQ